MASAAATRVTVLVARRRMSVWNQADYLVAPASLWRPFIQTIQGKPIGYAESSDNSALIYTSDYLGIHSIMHLLPVGAKPYFYFLEKYIPNHV